MQHKRFIVVIRELVECTRAFEQFSSAHVRQLDLTPAQFDIIATLGNTKGMTCKELGEKTLMTKGTLTGVLDRLEAKHLLERTASAEDGRSWIIRLTRKGDTLFDKVFPEHMRHLQPAFRQFSDAELDDMRTSLQQLRRALESAAD
jgi:DNA-binding MarR family transcriptional regulator